MTKKCYVCLQVLTLDLFAWKNKSKNLRSTICKSCQKVKSKEHYQKNKQRYIEGTRRRRKVFLSYRKEQIKQKKKNGCVVCGEAWQHALDLHHFKPEEKIGIVNSMPSKKLLDEELVKTIVLCANCHRKFHSDHLETIAFVSALASNELTQ